MAAAGAEVVAGDWAASLTWRQFRTAAVFVALAVGVGCLLYGVEKWLFDPPRRFVENPAEMMTRALGVAHFTVGWLFLFTSPKLRGPRPLARLLVWTAVGAALCAGYHLGGAGKNPLVLIAFYGLFLVHEVRDEAQ